MKTVLKIVGVLALVVGLAFGGLVLQQYRRQLAGASFAAGCMNGIMLAGVPLPLLPPEVQQEAITDCVQKAREFVAKKGL